MEIVTGASGFLGKHLVSRLDNPLCIPHQQIASAQLPRYDHLYFLSAYGNMADHTDDDAIIQANILDPLALVRQRSDFQSFTFVSSSSVKLNTQTMYSRTKRATEEVLMGYVDKHKLPICIIRPFSITGVGEQPNHLIPTLIRSCMEGTLMNFVPDPSHDFIDVDDVVNGIINLSENHAHGIFELGSGIKRTNLEVLEIVQQATGRKANINMVNRLRDYDNENWVSNNFRARSFGWLPTKSLEVSIGEMVNAYKRTAKKVS